MTAGLLDTTFLRDSTVNSVVTLFNSLGSWRKAEQFIAMAMPIILGGQRAVAQTTAADLSASLAELIGPGARLKQYSLAASSGKSLRGVRPEEVYRRPFEEIWRALQTKGELEFDAALERGTTRLRSLLETDLQLSATHTVANGTRGMAHVSYRRVPHNGSCALCAIASTQSYHSGSLMPIHPGCRCAVRLSAGNPLSDEVSLEQLHQSVADTFGPDAVDRSARSYKDLVVVRQHGEYGPTLARRSDHFDGPSQVAA